MDSDDRRVGDRKPASVRVKLKYADVETFIERYAANVSRGGIFIATKTPRPMGELVRFEFQLADGSPLIRGEGIVAWTKEPDAAAPGRQTGMAVQFGRLDAQGRALVDRMLTRRSAGETTAAATPAAPAAAPAEPAVAPAEIPDRPAMPAAGEAVPPAVLQTNGTHAETVASGSAERLPPRDEIDELAHELGIAPRRLAAARAWARTVGMGALADLPELAHLFDRASTSGGPATGGLAPPGSATSSASPSAVAPRREGGAGRGAGVAQVEWAARARPTRPSGPPAVGPAISGPDHRASPTGSATATERAESGPSAQAPAHPSEVERSQPAPATPPSPSSAPRSTLPGPRRPQAPAGGATEPPAPARRLEAGHPTALRGRWGRASQEGGSSPDDATETVARIDATDAHVVTPPSEDGPATEELPAMSLPAALGSPLPSSAAVPRSGSAPSLRGQPAPDTYIGEPPAAARVEPIPEWPTGTNVYGDTQPGDRRVRAAAPPPERSHLDPLAAFADESSLQPAVLEDDPAADLLAAGDLSPDELLLLAETSPPALRGSAGEESGLDPLSRLAAAAAPMGGGTLSTPALDDLLADEQRPDLATRTDSTAVSGPPSARSQRAGSGKRRRTSPILGDDVESEVFAAVDNLRLGAEPDPLPPPPPSNPGRGEEPQAGVIALEPLDDELPEGRSRGGQGDEPDDASRRRGGLWRKLFGK